jgi:uncharacterized protein (TIGR02598 family)
MHVISLQNGHARSTHAFSLVEIAMAIGIVAVAFVALFSLLPAGLNTYRDSIDTSNETWIMQSIGSMVQTMDYSRIKSEMDFETSEKKEVFYFDEEGRLIDRLSDPSSDKKVQLQRHYAVKTFVDEMDQVSKKAEPMRHSYRILALMAPVQNPLSMKEFDRIGRFEQARKVPENSKLLTRSFVVSRMDSET